MLDGAAGVAACELPEPPDPCAPDAEGDGLVLTGCIAGTGAPRCSVGPGTAVILGTLAPDVRKLEDRSDDFPAIRHLVGILTIANQTVSPTPHAKATAAHQLSHTVNFAGLLVAVRASSSFSR